MKILAATDGGEHSADILDEVLHFQLKPGDEIRVVSVIDMAIPLPVDLYGGFVPTTSDIESAVRNNVQKVIENAVLYLRDKIPDEKVLITSEALSGSPESRIVETAEEMNANLIIVGSHGYNRWERLLLGSVSDSVVHHAPCSVLIVRSRKP